MWKKYDINLKKVKQKKKRMLLCDLDFTEPFSSHFFFSDRRVVWT